MSGFSTKYGLLYIIFMLLSLLSAPGQGNTHYNGGSGYEQSATDEVEIEVFERDKPAMLEARLEGEVSGYTIWNSYDIDVYSSDVVGMVGVPIVVQDSNYQYDGASIDNHIEDELVLVFVYDESKLECSEEDLGILWYNEIDNWYDAQDNFEIDYENNEVAIPVQKYGTYILEDMESWWSVWAGTYEYDPPKQPSCHWHKEFVYEDIEALADISMYNEETTEYHITTVEQLAGLVKLVNEGKTFVGCDFYLDADLDLAGYDWAPIGWYFPANGDTLWRDYPFQGRFFGNGHTISNMRIVAPEQSDLGMFGRTLQEFEIHDFTLKDCYIEGKYYVGGILGDNINSGEDYDMTNCHMTGTVKGQLKSGALVGSSAYLKIKDCTAVVEEDSVQELTGDLRKGSVENCSISRKGRM